MNLKNNGYKQVISLIILTNFVGLGALFLLIRCYLETKSSEYLYGLFFLLFIVLMDLSFYAMRIFLFSKVVIEDGKLKEKLFKRTIKEIDLKDIQFLYIDIDGLFISQNKINIEEIGVGRKLNKLLFSKENIYFRVDLDRIDRILESIELDYCYISTRSSKKSKEKIKTYFDIREINLLRNPKKKSTEN